MLGSVEGKDHGPELNIMQSAIDKRSGKRSMRHKSVGITESGTCNVCSAPCSSCMHLKLDCVSKTGEMSDETRHMTALSQNSINDNCQCTASETSNLVSVNSSHDSLSENAESKVEVRSADTIDASIESKTCLKRSSEEVARAEQMPSDMHYLSDKRSYSINVGDSKVTEGLDDNISCLSKINDDSSVVSYSRKVSHRKNVLPKPDPVNGSEGKVFREAESADISGEKSTAVENSDALHNAKCIDEKKTLEANVKDTGSQVEAVSNQVKDAKEEKVCNEALIVPNPVAVSVSGEETSESDGVEHDVKVCDICGDAGREDMLAICSRCTDGAEHTYCMREMLQKIPDGDWLCEECKLSTNVENQKQGDPTKKENVQRYGKRHSEFRDLQLSTKRHASESCSGSPVPARLVKTAALSRESSFKNVERDKIRSNDPSSSSNQSGVDCPEAANTNIEQHLKQRGTFLKSSSFNAVSTKTKGSHGDEVSEKFKSSRGISSLEKEGSPKVFSKSMSFKSVNSSHAVGLEAKVRMLPMKMSPAAGTKGIKSITDKMALDRKSLSRLDIPQRSSLSKPEQKPLVRAESGVKSSVTTSKDLLAKRLEGKPGSLSRSNSILSRKGSEPAVLPVRASLANDSMDSRIHHPGPKDEPSSSSSWVADRPVNNDSDNLPDSFPKSKDHHIPGERAKDFSSSRLKPIDVANSKKEICQKCKEVGHASENCKQSGRGDLSGARKLKAAIEAAILKKPGIYRKKRVNEPSDGLLSTNMDTSSTINAIPTTNKVKELNTEEEVAEGKVNNVIASTQPFKRGLEKNAKQSTSISRPQGAITDSSFAVKAEDGDCLSHLSGMTGVPSRLPSVVVLPSTLPQHDWIWQGMFEISRSAGCVEICSGFQAHLSTSASPKVLDVVKQFPSKLKLDEVPRSCAWPSQFRSTGVKAENIALFFFAKDVESFEKHYKGLLVKSMNNDLALKGSFDGVDLLIYPSVQLPENLQRWNMLFFLWGVFHGRKPEEPTKKPIPANVDTIPSEVKEQGSAQISICKVSELPEAMDIEKSCKVDLECIPEAENEQSTPCPDPSSFPDEPAKYEVKNSVSSSKLCDGGTQKISGECGIHVEKPANEISSNSPTVKMETDINERDLNTEAENWVSSSKKRHFLDLSEEIPQIPELPTKDIQLNSAPMAHVDDEIVIKKQKIDLAERLKSPVCDMASTSSPRFYDEHLEPNERRFFPIELNDSDPNPLPWKDSSSNDINLLGQPNLELALGAERKPGNKQILPLFAGPSRSKTPEKLPQENDDDGVSASLSLSLSFPFSREEQSAKPEPKSEDGIHGKCNVNTNLFLYGGFPGKRAP